MSHELHPEFGYESVMPRQDTARKLKNVGMAAVRRCFSPEFVNRIDAVVVYQPLRADALAAIFDQQIVDLQEHIDKRMGERAFRLEVASKARRFLIAQGTSEQYGARELKRTLERLLVHPLASLVAAGEINPGSHIRAELSPRKNRLVLRAIGEEALLSAC